MLELRLQLVRREGDALTGVSRSRWTARLALALGLGLSGLLAAAPASAVVCGETVESTISVLGEIDTWTFQGAAGDVMSLSIGGQHRFTSFGVQAELRDPSNKNVYFRTIYNQSGNNFYCGPHLTCETRPLPATGTYTLRIFDFQQNATGTYSFTLGAVGGTWNGASNAPPDPVCGNVTDGTRVLACGETVAGQFEIYGDDDTYVFYADAGDRVAFSISRPPESVVNPAVELYAPDGAIVPVLAPYDGGVSYYCEFWSCVTAAPLPLSGVYTAKVTDSGITHLGAYSFTLESVAESFDGASNGPPAPTCGAADDGAQPIACGQRVAGTIGLEGDSDAYTFHADAGEGVALLVEQPAGSAVAPSAELYTPDGELVVAAGSPSAPVASGPLPESGVYTIKLTDAEIPDQTGAYALRIVSGQLGGAVCRAAPLLRCGETASGTLAAGEPKLFTFAALAGDAVRIHAGGAALPAVSLVAPDGAAVSAADPLPESGVYTLVLASAAGGAFAVTLEAVSGSVNGGGNGWPPLVCAGADGARSIGCGQTLAGSINVAGDSDVFTFLAEAGDVVTLGVNDAVAGFDPVAELFAPGGAVVALSGEGSCGPSESCVSAALPASGAYSIRVHEPSGAGTGAYSVSMSRSPCASDCQDGIDNDGDGLVDRAGDPGCATPDDLSERAECEDGFDNDGDGATDHAGTDAGCASATAAVEDPACDDGRDNDGDGSLDADGAGAGAADSYCGGVASNTLEAAPPSSGCGIGPELAALLPLVAGARRLARRRRR
jgi:hypothetical protein